MSQQHEVNPEGYCTYPACKPCKGCDWAYENLCVVCGVEAQPDPVMFDAICDDHRKAFTRGYTRGVQDGYQHMANIAEGLANMEQTYAFKETE